MNVNEIELALSQKITSSSSNLDVLVATKVLSYLKTNGIFTASSYGGLPAAASNEGKLYFVEDLETVFWSDGTDWLRILDKQVQPINELWTWGLNYCGILGDGTTTNTCSPVREFCSSIQWCQVDSSGIHMTSVKTSGQIWSWGRNFCGVLGDGTTTDTCSPVREFCSATDWCQVSVGSTHAIAIKTGGTLWAWGQNGQGRLGNGTTTDTCSPVSEHCSATNWCQASAGSQHTAAIKTDGTLWSWGSSERGQIGDGLKTCRCSPVRERCSATNWCQASAGHFYTAAIKTDGTLWTWGLNCYGTLAIGRNSTVYSMCSPVQEYCSATDWSQVDSKCLHMAAIKTDGTLWVWGQNNCGQLGIGSVFSRCSPVIEICSSDNWCSVGVGGCHTLAVKTTGELWAWGQNNCAQLGDGTQVTRTSPVREVCSATDWCYVNAGHCQSVAIKLV